MEAMERQKELEPTINSTNGADNPLQEQSSVSCSQHEELEGDDEKNEKSAEEDVVDIDTNSWRKEDDEKKEDETVNVSSFYFVFS